MRKLFDRQIEKSTNAAGEIDLAALAELVNAAYEEADEDRKRTDRSIELMVGELTDFQAGLEAEIKKRTAQLQLSKQKLRVQNTRFLTALENMSQGLAMFDKRQRLVVCNHQYLEMYNLPRRYGRRGTSLVTILKARIAAGTAAAGDDPAAYIRERLDTVTDGVSSSVTHHLDNGRVLSVSHRAMADGGWVTMHRDITELHTMQVELARQAYHDALTGLPNRNLWYQRLAEAFAALEHDGGSFAVLCLDLDGFKPINDSLGHASGDQLLRQVAERLRQCVGAAGFVGRMGGDEFAVLQPGGTAETAEALAAAIVEAIRRPFDVDDHAVLVGVSIGVAIAPEHGADADRLLKSGDLALYWLKRGHRGGHRLFEPALADTLTARGRMERDLRRALGNGEFELFYQPVFDLESQSISGFEALLRWRHPTDGVIMPAEFIPLAEELGLIVPIGEWVIREAFAEATLWPAPLHVAVNVSSGQFGRGNLAPVVMNALAATRLAPERVEIEITETLFLEDSTSNIETLHRLHQLGLKVALDDFGTGYSGLGYLLAFPFDKLKIDGSFVQALETTPGAEAILKAVSEIGASLGITTTAEGIQTPEQLRTVKALGYTEAQGFLISPPMPRDLARRLLELAHPSPPTKHAAPPRGRGHAAAG